MKSNNLILLDRIIEDEAKNCSSEISAGLFFEYFCANLLLKNYDLSKEELLNGIVDGKDDGGFDAVYIFVNGLLINDSEYIQSLKGNLDIEVVIITSKHADTFEQAVINSEYSTACEFFDLSRDNNNLTCPYNETLLDKRNLFIMLYTEKIQNVRDLTLNYFFVSRSDENNIGENVKAKADQLVIKTRELLSNSECSYSFLGCSSLLNLYRKPKNFNLSLPYVKNISADVEKYIILCKLSDYYSFITDDGKSLKRYLFDSNVRDFNGYNRTNTDIMDSLETDDEVDFWWLNNGITILSSHAYDIGTSIKMDNVQIVNGLQTSFSIYDFFKNNPDRVDDRKILVKIITENDSAIRDRIIRATNNQTAVQEETLHATDKYQRDIESILLPYGFFYERKKNYYYNKGVDTNKLITPLFLASGFFALLDRDLVRAINLKQKFMTNDIAYKKVFVDTNINSWPRIAVILSKADEAITQSNYTKGIKAERKFRILRSIVSFIIISKHFGSFNYSDEQLASLPIDIIDTFDYELIIRTIFDAEPSFDKSQWNKREIINKIVTYSASSLSINDLSSYIRRKHKIFNDIDNLAFCRRIYLKIKPFIPPQPWPKDIHKFIAKKLRMNNNAVYSALSYGVSIGDYYYQKDSKLFDSDGKEIRIKIHQINEKKG